MLSQKVPCCVFQRPSSTVCSNSGLGLSCCVFDSPQKQHTLLFPKWYSSTQVLPPEIFHQWAACFFNLKTSIWLVWVLVDFLVYLPRTGKLHFQPSFSLEIYPAHNVTNMIVRTDSIRSVCIILLLPSKVRYWKPHWNNVTFTSKQSKF